jgi:hypothetical protein
MKTALIVLLMAGLVLAAYGWPSLARPSEARR